MTALQSKWDKLDLMLESHSLMIKEQVEVMKAGVKSRVDTFEKVFTTPYLFIFVFETFKNKNTHIILFIPQAIGKFAARWTALKPNESALGDRLAAIKAIG